MFIVPSKISKHIFYPLWDIYDRSVKLEEMAWLERNEREPLEKKKDRQWRRLKEIVDYAHANCEFYSKRPKPVFNSESEFRRIPILSKEDVRAYKDSLISREFNKSQLADSKTGGSTGVSLELLFDVKCQEKRNGAALWSNRWCGWDLGDPVGALWGNPPLPGTFKELVRSQLLDRFIFLDTVRLTDESMTAFANEVIHGSIHFLFGHSHSIYIFAKFVEASKINGLDIRGIVSTSMMLLPSERAEIERIFGCKVTDRYGCEEVSLIGCECEQHKGMHLNMDHLYVEFIKDNGQPARPGEQGDLVITDLLNRGMPLIRYKLGDVAVPSDRVCPCGRTQPIMEGVVGRTADFLVRRDGSLVAGVSLVERTLTAIPGLEQLQIIQETREEIKLNVVPDADYGPAAESKLLAEMKTALGGDIRFEVRKISRIEQEKNGKYRFSVCKVGSRYQAVG